MIKNDKKILKLNNKKEMKINFFYHLISLKFF